MHFISGLAFWKDCEIRCNDQLISSMDGLYYLNAYLQVLLYYNDETRRTQLERLGFFDEADTNNADPYSTDGFAFRHELVDKSKTATCQTQIFHPLHCQPR